jgi:hypothetical protein
MANEFVIRPFVIDRLLAFGIRHSPLTESQHAAPLPAAFPDLRWEAGGSTQIRRRLNIEASIER